MVGVGVGAKQGILIRNGEILEKVHRLTSVVFDKTGTLTKGHPEVTDVLIAPGVKEKRLWEIASSLGTYSEHPLALAICRRASEKEVSALAIENFSALPGKGVQAYLQGGLYLMGNSTLLQERKIDATALAGEVERLSGEGKSLVYVAGNGEVVGLFALADEPKESALPALARLREMGLKVMMLTGDNRNTAAAIAARLGIDRVLAEVLPHAKEEAIKKLQEEREVVAMVGDGINDAPALARAEVGIALGAGTDIAIEASGITLVRDDLTAVPRAIALSRRTLGAIYQNLFFASVYNLIGIPIAAGVLYPFFGLLLNPEIAAVAMALSSVSVVGNSLRLWREGKQGRWV
jgi:Cu+-exporting ATPase